MMRMSMSIITLTGVLPWREDGYFMTRRQEGQVCVSLRACSGGGKKKEKKKKKNKKNKNKNQDNN